MSSVMRFDEWQDSDGNPVFNGAGGVSPGGLVAVKSAIFTGIQVESSIGAGANFAVTDLSITHEVADSANKLIISAFIGIAANSNGIGQVGIAVHDGTGLVAVGASPGNRTAVTAGNIASTGSTVFVSNPVFSLVHTPGAGSKTYTLRAINLRGDTQTLFINRSQDDDNDGFRPRGVSSLVIQEVAV